MTNNEGLVSGKGESEYGKQIIKGSSSAIFSNSRAGACSDIDRGPGAVIDTRVGRLVQARSGTFQAGRPDRRDRRFRSGARRLPERQRGLQNGRRRGGRGRG